MIKEIAPGVFDVCLFEPSNWQLVEAENIAWHERLVNPSIFGKEIRLHMPDAWGDEIRAPGRHNSMYWHQDGGTDWLILWANIKPTLLRSYGVEFALPAKHICVFDNRLYEHRPPELTQAENDSRWLCRGFFLSRPRFIFNLLYEPFEVA